LSPRSAQPLLNLASLQIQAADEAEDRAAFLGRALANLANAIAMRPSSAVAHTLSGAAHVKASAPREAENSFKQALAIDSDMPAARLMLANLYIREERWSDALEHLDLYLDHHPFASDRSLVKNLRAEVEINLRGAGDRTN
jgi:tetratricopeptide (TPR) repeat protein